MRNPIPRRQVIVGGAAGLAALATGVACGRPLFLPSGNKFDSAGRPIPIVGFAGGSAYVYANATDQSRMLDVITAGQATGIRFDIPWIHAQPAATTFNWGFVDTAVNAAYNRGLFILGTITTCPGWAAGTNNGDAYNRPRSAADYANFCAAVASRYNGKIDAYEIWNEPNGCLFFSPHPDPAFYTSMVKAAYPKIKAVDSGITVVVGALGATATADGQIDATSFMTSMYQNGVKGFSDAMSFHPCDFSAPFASGVLYDNAPMRQMIDMHALMKANGEGAKKIWPTEYGAPTVGSITQDKQNDLIFNSLQQWREVSYAGPMFVCTMRDAKTRSANTEGNFGLVTSANAPKKALYGLASLVRAGFPKRQQRAVFEANADPALGPSVSPVFRISDGYGYEFENGTRYLTKHGPLSSPTDVATIARRWQLVPSNAFANGMQDMDIAGGFRVFSRSDTGTHTVYGAILAAWTPDLGFPTTDEYTPYGAPNSRAVDFQFGRITWSMTGGAQVVWTRDAVGPLPAQMIVESLKALAL